MASSRTKATTVQEYIALAPKHAQKKLREMRGLLKKAVPGAIEGLKWGAPAFSYKRILFAYAAFKDHVSLMPTPPVINVLKKELGKYKTTAATIQFPYDKSLPKSLIKKVARLRVKESRLKDVRWM